MTINKIWYIANSYSIYTFICYIYILDIRLNCHIFKLLAMKIHMYSIVYVSPFGN